MTAQELLFTKMFPEEEKKWQELCDAIRGKFASTELPSMAYKEMEKMLAPGTPYTGAKGYVESDGYFYVEAGDRGNCTLVFITQSKKEAEELLMKKFAHDVSYRCVVTEMKEIEQEHRNEWRFYTVVDKIEQGRVISHEEENADWKYDTKYDYRKYWFELALYILRGNVSECSFLTEVKEYESLMNYRLEQPFWNYDTEKMEFVSI